MSGILAGFVPAMQALCDWLWENPPLTHKSKYLEIRIANSIIQSVISREGIKLQAYNLLQI